MKTNFVGCHGGQIAIMSSELPTPIQDGIHRDFDIPTNVLGFTVAAAGTSFPNVFSGMCVARQGKARHAGWS